MRASKMVPVKKRKMDGSEGGSRSGSSTPAAMSAFAARQQLWGAAATKAAALLDKGTPEPTPDNTTQPARSQGENPLARSVAGRSSKRRAPEEPVSVEAEQTQATGSKGEKGRSSPSTPRPESSSLPVRQHSSFKPTKKNLQKKAGGRLVLSTPDAERLVILGSYGIKVRQGEATIAGTILRASDDVQWVHSPLCHALPVLRTVDETVLELQPHPAATGLRELAKLNPAFARLWNESLQGADSNRSRSSSTFQIVYTSEDVSKRSLLQELVSPAEWNKKLSALAAANRKSTPVVFLCGPKSSGKSTFGKLLANRLMTDRGGSKNKPWSSVMVLDIDPGQPEYSPPGVISLTRITTPNLAPSFCHPSLTPAEGQIRAHAIASVTPAQDPAHFIECVLDLFHHYRRGPDARSPLVINTPGWIQGTGLDILTELIASLRPTEVIYTSQDGPEETVGSLQSACATTKPPTPFSTLPSQPTEPSSSRTSLHFRTMQTMSYFHMGHHRPSQQQQPYPTWDPTPLTDVRPWRVRYAGEDRGFLGIFCYDHQPAPELLAEAINGTVLALVQLEDRQAALRGLRVPGLSATDADTDADTDMGSPTPTLTATAITNDMVAPHQTQTHPQTTPTPTEGKPNNNTTKANTNKTNTTKTIPLIPLIPNPQGQTLSPHHSHTLGLALVRGIDPACGELQLLTPIPAETLLSLSSLAGAAAAGAAGGAAGTSSASAAGVGVGGGHDNKGLDLVLVAGRFDTPCWAYGEGLSHAAAGGGVALGKERGGRGGGSGSGGHDGGVCDDDSGDDEEGEGDDEGDGDGEEGEQARRRERGMAVPWVEMLHGSEKRAVGSKVWRVRRDLGRG
ncbi:hypothetical protein N658DRAFT_559658 [Parathielavia hyrcaniae]|uniref:Polynucleotide 5'-hydroxyl-kinase GRC3 n=1 Tax=Parathielavia hyrcaniae TaxID=113614 RepID=A0AAN6T0A4_9PEZI|nr:hypothetical protein N658DRAFT_559658 [Parathielavia hyrcaniae]